MSKVWLLSVMFEDEEETPLCVFETRPTLERARKFLEGREEYESNTDGEGEVLWSEQASDDEFTTWRFGGEGWNHKLYAVELDSLA